MSKTHDPGCLILQQLRRNGQYLVGFNESAHKPFKVAQQIVKNSFIPAFLDTEDRLKAGQIPQFNHIRPPFPECWIEIAASGVRFGYYVREEPIDGSDDKLVHIVGWQGECPVTPTRPRSACAFTLRTNKLGKALGFFEPHHLYTSQMGEQENSDWQQMIAAYCCETLQTMNILQVGFKPVTDAQEKSRDPAHRNAAVGRRYHTLVLRTRKECRSRDKIVTRADALPFHQVRGHIRKCGIDGRQPLFGWFVGELWIPSYDRGNTKNGTIEKGYKLDVPAHVGNPVPPISVAFDGRHAHA